MYGLAIVIMVSARKFIIVATKNLGHETVHTGMFVEQGNERNLVRVRSKYQITTQQDRIEEVLRAIVVTNVIKARIGRVGSIEQSVVAIILKVNIEMMPGVRSIVKECQWIFKPD
jgi:hypothetical protein